MGVGSTSVCVKGDWNSTRNIEVLGHLEPRKARMRHSYIRLLTVYLGQRDDKARQAKPMQYYRVW